MLLSEVSIDDIWLTGIFKGKHGEGEPGVLGLLISISDILDQSFIELSLTVILRKRVLTSGISNFSGPLVRPLLVSENRLLKISPSADVDIVNLTFLWSPLYQEISISHISFSLPKSNWVQELSPYLDHRVDWLPSIALRSVLLPTCPMEVTLTAFSGWQEVLSPNDTNTNWLSKLNLFCV